MADTGPTAEERRLADARTYKAHWKRWGPYVSERAWGTVREDYSANGDAWNYLPHDHARSKAYRWNEDGIAGICDRHQYICFALALWNEKDPFLKERLFGLTGPEGNHAEDVKEHYFYLDNTPTHSYMKYLYKYPQAEFPYARLVEENRRRGKLDREFELVDTGVFNESRYFDVMVEYAKAAPDDLLVLITASNRGPEPARLHVLPTLWFPNIWSWRNGVARPRVFRGPEIRPHTELIIDHAQLGPRYLYCEGRPELLFTDNETNTQRLYGATGPKYAKDGIHDYVVHGRRDAVNPEEFGTKAAPHYALTLAPGESVQLRLRLTDKSWPEIGEPLGADFNSIMATRKAEADEFYATVIPQDLSEDARNVMRQSIAGLLWSKQFYHYVQREWLHGDPAQPAPPHERYSGRNHDWPNLFNADVISMPDKWEYPWYAAWDLAFHCIALAMVDSDFAKEQLVLLTREWYMHPNGQFPAYEWSLGDVNPPVHAWAAWRVYKIDKKQRGHGDRAFLVRVFHKLLLNFTWWVNRKDADGMNVFQGGFLGLDNIGVFDRSAPLPTGGVLEQSDGTSWMAMYTLNLLAIAFELAKDDPAYEDVASKFWEHFLYIANAMSNRGHDGHSMWNEEDGFFYDVLKLPDGSRFPMKVRSMVGLIPLFAVETLDSDMLHRMPSFKRRMDWFIENRPDLINQAACMKTKGDNDRRLMSIVDGDELRSILHFMLDENEFLSPYGIRSLSKVHEREPYVVEVDGHQHSVDYEPGESTSNLFGGNSNWRGPIWFPVNFLIIESLQRFHYYLGDDFKIEFPTGSGKYLTLWDIAGELSRRLSSLFMRDASGVRPALAVEPQFQSDPHWRDLVLFYEFFHGDNGAGLGASHQTGWTGLVAKLIQQSGEKDIKRADAIAAVAAD